MDGDVVIEKIDDLLSTRFSDLIEKSMKKIYGYKVGRCNWI